MGGDARKGLMVSPVGGVLGVTHEVVGLALVGDGVYFASSAIAPQRTEMRRSID